MSALRLASLYLRFMPTQRWVMLVAFAAMVCGVLIAGLPGTNIFLAGALILIFFPSLLGGLAMRMTSGGSGLRLRPAGYRKMLCGALLATVLLTAIQTIPVLLAVRFHWILSLRGLTQPLMNAPGAAEYMLGAWSVISITWLLVFCAVLSPLRVLAVGALMMLAGALSGAYLDQDPPFEVLPAIAVAGWVAFAAWYLRGPKLPNMVTSLQIVGRRQDKRSILDSGAEGREVALRAYLTGATSWRTYLGSIAAALASIVPLAMMSALGTGPRSLFIVPFAFLTTMPGGALAAVIMRRARYLWLKAGLDREALFRVVERATARSAVAIMMIYATSMVLIAAFLRPGTMTTTLLFGMMFAAFGIGVMYAVLCVVRPWRAVHAIPLTICLVAWTSMVIALLPEKDPDQSWYAIATAASLGMAALLRALARRRWRRIDWQLLRPNLLSTGSRMQLKS